MASHPAPGYTIARGWNATGVFTVTVKVGSASALFTGKAAVLILLLTRAHAGPDHLPKWMTVGDVLQAVGRTAPGLFDRRAFDALVADVHLTFLRSGIPGALLQTDESRGVRLAARPTRIERTSRPGTRGR